MDEILTICGLLSGRLQPRPFIVCPFIPKDGDRPERKWRGKTLPLAEVRGNDNNVLSKVQCIRSNYEECGAPGWNYKHWDALHYESGIMYELPPPTKDPYNPFAMVVNGYSCFGGLQITGQKTFRVTLGFAKSDSKLVIIDFASKTIFCPSVYPQVFENTIICHWERHQRDIALNIGAIISVKDRVEKQGTIVEKVGDSRFSVQLSYKKGEFVGLPTRKQLDLQNNPIYHTFVYHYDHNVAKIIGPIISEQVSRDIAQEISRMLIRKPVVPPIFDNVASIDSN